MLWNVMWKEKHDGIFFCYLADDHRSASTICLPLTCTNNQIRPPALKKALAHDILVLTVWYIIIVGLNLRTWELYSVASHCPKKTVSHPQDQHTEESYFANTLHMHSWIWTNQNFAEVKNRKTLLSVGSDVDTCHEETTTRRTMVC